MRYKKYMKDKLKKDDQIMKILKVSEVRRLICGTEKGMLELFIRKGENNYALSLDSVPLDKETNKELMDLLFKPEDEKIPEVNKDFTVSPINNTIVVKKGGRPKKNK